MGLKCLASVLWLSHCLSIVFSVSREFSGNGYLKYDIVGKAANKPINSDVDELRVKFKSVQPSGLLFHTQNSGGALGDYLTLELCGGRLCFGMQLGARKDDADKKTEILGKDLSNGRAHEVLVNHNKLKTTIVLNQGTLDEETREITTRYEKLDADTAIYIGGAPNFQSLQGVKSNAAFMGCLTDVEFKPEGVTNPIKFLVKGVADAVNVDMNKECPSAPTFEPYTFVGSDSSFTFNIKKDAAMTGSFKFRSYQKSGTLLKQVNLNNGFTISYRERYIGLSVKIGNTATDVSFTYSANEQKMNSGNWHSVEFVISGPKLSLKVGTKAPTTKAPSETFPANFFGNEAIAGGFTGCMRDLKINNEEKKPLVMSGTKNVEMDRCNITDLCIFTPCLNKGSCSQDGRSFTCDCSTSGYEGAVCQFPESSQNCEQLKKRIGKDNAKDGNWTLDLDGPGPLKASSGIYCNMTADPPITVVYSEDKGVKVITDNNAGTISQPYVADIRYYPSLAFAKALAMNSANCKQFIEFGCKNAKLLNVGGKQRLGYWVSAGGVYQDYWGGAPPGKESCACGVNNTCLPNKNKKCNCDADDDSWTKDEGFLTATADLPVTQVVFMDVNPKKSEANFTVGNLYCSGNISNTATFVNEDGMIKLSKWIPPSHGVISLFFRTPYPKGIILFNGLESREYFKLYIINKTSVGLEYNIGNGYQRVELSLKGSKEVNDRQWHEVVIYRNMKEFGFKLDTEKGVNLNPLFLKKGLDLEDNLYVGGNPAEVTEGFVGCIRGLTINGEVIDLNKKAGSAEYVKGGCGAACKDNACKLGGKCLDNYNVYKCDCSLTPFYNYFCHKDYGASFQDKDSQLTYTFPNPENFPGVNIVVGFKVKDKDSCGGDLVEITSETTDESFLLRLEPGSKKLKFSYKSLGGDGSFEIDPPFSDFCDQTRHTFALSRRNEKINYTVDGQSKPTFNEDRLTKPFPKMHKVIIGRKGDTGFKGCITGVKVTPIAFETPLPTTVQPIKDFLYDGVTKDMESSGLSGSSKEKCGPEPDVPKDIPTPRAVGIPDGSDNTATRADPTSGQRADSDNTTAIIIVVVLILVLLLVVLLVAIYWYWARHKGEYHTHEDDDELKSADPYIDMTAPRKPIAEDTEKKKEWYI